MAYFSRKSTRLPGYDYSRINYYFVTICTHNKSCIFGTIKQLNEIGEIAKYEMNKITSQHQGVYIDNFIIMPNHVHAIVVLEYDNKEGKKPRLDNVIGLYKSGVSRKNSENTT
jgi:REP element-mobilizing transposase RayT